jgi:hypothetical protein
MGTHGRNAVTIHNEHICHEQTLDGHDAAYDLTEPILTKLEFVKFPTMDNKTNECNHGCNFAHIDYDRRIIYTSYNNPKIILAMTDDKIKDEYEYDDDEFVLKIRKQFKTYLKNQKRLEIDKWKFVYDCCYCPAEYKCVNSIQASINDFINKTDRYKLASELGNCAIIDFYEMIGIRYMYDDIYLCKIYEKSILQYHFAKEGNPTKIFEFVGNSKLIRHEVSKYLKR